MTTRHCGLWGAAAFLLCMLASAATAQSGGGYELSWHTIDGGGGFCTDNDYGITGTAGQPDAGVLLGSDYSVSGGFWAGVAAGCVGDCNQDGKVTVNEVITGVNIALGTSPLAQCPSLDASGDGRVTINEVIRSVNNALNGCG